MNFLLALVGGLLGRLTRRVVVTRCRSQSRQDGPLIPTWTKPIEMGPVLYPVSRVTHQSTNPHPNRSTSAAPDRVIDQRSVQDARDFAVARTCGKRIGDTQFQYPATRAALARSLVRCW